MAHLENRPNDILGWILSEEKEGVTVVHYLYVKDAYLKYPVAQVLLDHTPGTKPGYITHYLKHRIFRTWKLTPEIARRKSL